MKLKYQVDLGVSTITNFVFNIFRLGDGLMRGAVVVILILAVANGVLRKGLGGKGKPATDA